MNYTEAVKRVNTKAISSLVVLLFCGLFSAAAQMSTTSASPYHILGKSLVELKKEPTPAKVPTLPVLLTAKQDNLQIGPTLTKTSHLNYQAPKVYSMEHLAFFCRLEVRMEKASKMPVRFRLGSVDYVDRMEGKY